MHACRESLRGVRGRQRSPHQPKVKMVARVTDQFQFNGARFIGYIILRVSFTLIYQAVFLHREFTILQAIHVVARSASFATQRASSPVPSNRPGPAREAFYFGSSTCYRSRAAQWKLEGGSIAPFRTMMTRRFVRLRSQLHATLSAECVCLVEIQSGLR